MTYHVGVDIGGTFTDTIVIDEVSGEVRMSKVPSTPPNQAVGFLKSLHAADIDFSEISWLVHGTTVGTNATLERNGAVCGMITTRGFRDIIELGRRDRPRLYGLFGEFHALISRDHRIEVPERMSAAGEIMEALDEAAIEKAAIDLKNRGCEALLIGFLNSYANPTHEKRAAEIAARVWGNPHITISSDILAEFREVERFGTAAVNAYIQPLIHRYVTKLKSELKTSGVPRELVIMQANGGIMSADTACDRAVNTVLSGPAAGVIAASYISRLSGFHNVITADMGGTSFDVGIIVNDKPTVANDRDLDFRIPMRIPIIDIHTIGAGGGSIAHINKAGILQVGPQSAGAIPGPVAFGKGGTKPAVADANVLLGRLSAEKLLSVNGGVDLNAVRNAFDTYIAKPLAIDAYQAAAAVLRVVNDSMAAAIRLVSLQRGLDPREFALFAFGGAGPLHGVALARELGIPKVIIPYVPGITCAMGCIVADVRHDFVRAIVKPAKDLQEKDLRAVLMEQRTAGEDRLNKEQVPVDRIEVVHEADMQYTGQTWTLRVSIDIDQLSVKSLEAQLHKAYLDRYGIDLAQFQAKLINLRTSVIGVRPQLDLKRIIASAHRMASVEEARLGSRKVWFGDGFLDTPIFERNALPIGANIEGPAILNQMDSTTVVEPDSTVTVDEYGNLIIEIRS
jgi:N-methylhydantoinase A